MELTGILCYFMAVARTTQNRARAAILLDPSPWQQLKSGEDVAIPLGWKTCHKSDHSIKIDCNVAIV